MGMSEADTRANLIDPVLRDKGWTQEYVKREETARAIPTSGSNALRAEVDEAAWSALYSTKSYPFDPPQTGKIAVKVINHNGDEVLKVYPV